MTRLADARDATRRAQYRWWLLWIIVSLIVAAGAILEEAGAHDEGEGSCVTWHEYGHADEDVRMAVVHDIFDTDGRIEEVWSGTGDVTRSYPSCADSTPRFCVDYWQGLDGVGAYKVWRRYVGPCRDPEGNG